MKKKIIVLAIAAAMLFTGCGSAKDGNSADKNAGKNTGKSIETTITVGGKTHTFSAKEGISDFEDIQFGASAGMNRDTFFVVENGNIIRDKEISKDAIQAIYPTDIRMINPVLCPSFTITDDGRRIIGYRTLETKVIGNFDPDVALFEFEFVNDFSYMGITQESEEKDILAAGFKPFVKQGCYINIYSPTPVDWDDVAKDYDKFVEEEISNAKILMDPKRAFSYGDYYYLAWMLSPIDYMKNDLGFDNADAKNESYEKNFCNNQPASDNVFKDVHVNLLAIAKEMKMVNEGDIEYFIVSVVTTEESKCSPSWGTTCTIMVFSTEENVKSWLEGWGMM